MKVLLIDVNCKIGSTGKIVYELHTQLTKDGHTSAICYGRGLYINEKGIYKFSRDWETYMHAMLTRITGLMGYYSFFSTRKLIKFIKGYKPDVVHIHELHSYFVNIAPIIKFLKKNKIKTILTLHCEFMYTGKCGHANECEKWKNECGKCPSLKEYPSSLIFDFTRKMFNDKKDLFKDFNSLTIVTPSTWLANRVRQSFLKDKKIEVVHNGIDTEKVFYPRVCENLKRKYNIKDEKVILAVAPNLMSKNKGGRYVLELAKCMKNENVKFILIGVDDLNEKFEGNVIALGRTNNAHELAEYYSLADIFVICSYRETFSQTCIEALSCGTPIYGFDAGGNVEIVPKEYGSFVKYGDIEALYSSIMMKLNSTSNDDFCIKFSSDRYSKEKMYEGYKYLYLH